MGNALVRLRSGGKIYSGTGLSTDIIGASIRAYVNAVNKIVYEGGVSAQVLSSVSKSKIFSLRLTFERLLTDEVFLFHQGLA